MGAKVTTRSKACISEVVLAGGNVSEQGNYVRIEPYGFGKCAYTVRTQRTHAFIADKETLREFAEAILQLTETRP